MVNLKNGMVIHCDTEEKANIFLELCKKQGCIWASNGDLHGYNHWNIHEDKTCYIIEWSKPIKKFVLYYSNLDYFVEHNHHVIKFNHLNLENNYKSQQLSLF